MRKRVITGILAAAVPALLLAGGPAQAHTCKMSPQACLQGNDHDGDSDDHDGDRDDHDRDRDDRDGKDYDRNYGVPEPATMVLLTTGFAAAGFAAWRRRKS